MTCPHLFWKIFVNFLTSTLFCAKNTTLLSKAWQRFVQILWPSQKIQTLTIIFGDLSQREKISEIKPPLIQWLFNAQVSYLFFRHSLICLFFHVFSSFFHIWKISEFDLLLVEYFEKQSNFNCCWKISPRGF